MCRSGFDGCWLGEWGCSVVGFKSFCAFKVLLICDRVGSRSCWHLRVMRCHSWRYIPLSSPDETGHVEWMGEMRRKGYWCWWWDKRLCTCMEIQIYLLAQPHCSVVWMVIWLITPHSWWVRGIYHYLPLMSLGLIFFLSIHLWPLSCTHGAITTMSMCTVAKLYLITYTYCKKNNRSFPIVQT